MLLLRVPVDARPRLKAHIRECLLQILAVIVFGEREPTTTEPHKPSRAPHPRSVMDQINEFSARHLIVLRGVAWSAIVLGACLLTATQAQRPGRARARSLRPLLGEASRRLPHATPRKAD